MHIEDIARVEIDWMQGYVNDPRIKIILKRGKKMAAWEDFRFDSSGNLFYSVLDNEVIFYSHDRNNHDGFGGRCFPLRMKDDWTPECAGWRDCIHCGFDPESHILTLCGPWKISEVSLSRIVGECVAVSAIDGDDRESVRNPNRFQRHKRRFGKNAYAGTFTATSVTLEFARLAVDTLAPSYEMWQVDYGCWTVKKRGLPPKNPRRHPDPVFVSNMSAEQSAAILF